MSLNQCLFVQYLTQHFEYYVAKSHGKIKCQARMVVKLGSSLKIIPCPGWAHKGEFCFNHVGALGIITKLIKYCYHCHGNDRSATDEFCYRYIQCVIFFLARPDPRHFQKLANNLVPDILASFLGKKGKKRIISASEKMDCSKTLISIFEMKAEITEEQKYWGKILDERREDVIPLGISIWMQLVSQDKARIKRD
jgi:hypothetical protein